MLDDESPPQYRMQAHAWARLARAAAAAERPRAPVEANRELFDAIEYAATEARLDVRELADAYAAGAPKLDFIDAWESVEDYLERISRVQEGGIGRAHARVERARPDWRRRLGLRIAAHDLALAAHRVLGGQDERIEQTRLAVADVLEGARAADASQEELDAFIQQLRVEQCDLVSVISTAAWIAAERARLAQRRGLTLPAPSWATTAEIADDRGAPLDIVAALVEDALNDGLLALHERGVVVTAAGHERILRTAAS